MSLHAILKDPECKGNIQSAMWAVVVTLGMPCLMLFGFAWLSTAEKISADIYGARHLESRITVLENRPVLLMEHTHRYSDGKIRKTN